jgi:hypothetical protein
MFIVRHLHGDVNVIHEKTGLACNNFSQPNYTLASLSVNLEDRGAIT